jgi:hypothetical protein
MVLRRDGKENGACVAKNETPPLPSGQKSVSTWPAAMSLHSDNRSAGCLYGIAHSPDEFPRCGRTYPRLADCDEVSRHCVRQELRRGCVITSNPAHQVERDGTENIDPQQRAIWGAVYPALAVAEFIGFGIGSYLALPDLQEGNGKLAIVVGSH